jgi:hypothetical protein
VADRFHLIQNLQQAVQTELACQRAHLTISVRELRRTSETERPPVAAVGISRSRRVRPHPSQDEVRRQRRQQKVELFQLVKSLRAQGLKVIDIMRQAGISRGLANKWLRLEECSVWVKTMCLRDTWLWTAILSRPKCTSTFLPQSRTHTDRPTYSHGTE